MRIKLGVLITANEPLDSGTAGYDGVSPRDGAWRIVHRHAGLRVLPDWTDEEVIQILENCRTTMMTSARLLIIDALIGPPNEQSPGHFYDITFLVLLNGRVRTEEEYSALLRQTGFRLQRVLPTESDVSILEACAI